MAVGAGPAVLTEAIVLKRIQIGGHEVTEELEDPITHEVTEFTGIVPDFAEPGDRIDVSEWANVDAYVRQGIIHMVTPDIDHVIAVQKNASPGRRTNTNQKGRANG